MKTYFLIALGSGLGGAARLWVAKITPGRADFPWETFLVNFLGSVAIGWIATLPEARLAPETRLFLTMGVMGGFTTFSTFSLQTVNLFSAGKTGMALLYITASVIACVLGSWAGVSFGRPN